MRTTPTCDETVSMHRFDWMETATCCLNHDTNLGIDDCDLMSTCKQEPWYMVDATNGGGEPFDKSNLNATENSNKFEWFVKEPKRKFSHIF